MKKPFEAAAGMVPLRVREESEAWNRAFFPRGAKDTSFGIHKPEHTDFSTISLILKQGFLHAHVDL